MNTRTKISYILPYDDGNYHRFGINKLLFDDTTKSLFSAGRDGTIKLWSVENMEEKPKPIINIQAHFDWINDFILHNNEILISCSSDNTVKLWDKEGNNIHSIRAHLDYAKCLASSSTENKFVSGGLDNSIYLWDIEKSKTILKTTDYFPAEIPSKRSVYSIAMSEDANIIATASSDRFIRIFDTRISLKKKISKLRGHSDNIRSLLMTKDGKTIISGGSDNLIKVWDVSQEKSFKTFSEHDDSIFTLSFEDDLSEDKFLSGGKDGKVVHYDLTKNQYSELLTSKYPILSVANVNHQSLFVSTTKCDITMWDFDLSEQSPLSSRTQSFSTSPIGTKKSTFDKRKFSQMRPKKTIKGAPGIHKYYLLNDKIHVLAEDNEKILTKWNITTGKLEENYGIYDIEKKYKELEEMTHVQNWVSCDTKLGCLDVVLEPPKCFNGEVYAIEAGFTESGLDDKVNYGQMIIKNIFKNWYENKYPLEEEKKETEEEKQKEIEFKKSLKKEELKQYELHLKRKEDLRKFEIRRRKIDDYVKFTLPEETLVIIHHENDMNFQCPIYKRIKDFNGKEAQNEIPDWVEECFKKSELEGSISQKIAFMVNTYDSKQLPPFKKMDKLHAHRILRIPKVCSFVISNLNLKLPSKENFESFKLDYHQEKDEELRYKKTEAFLSSIKKDEENQVKPEEYIEILCRDKVVNPEYNLGVVYSFYRGNNSTIILNYRLKL